jgi:predicted helicase
MSEPYTPSVAPNSALPVGHNESVSDVGRISDFRTLLSTLSLDALTRGKQFERVTKWCLEDDPIHSRQIENVWLWDEWPRFPRRT